MLCVSIATLCLSKSEFDLAMACGNREKPGLGHYYFDDFKPHVPDPHGHKLVAIPQFSDTPTYHMKIYEVHCDLHCV